VIHYPDSLLTDPLTRGSRRRCCATQLRPFLYAVLVVPGALLLHVIVVTMFSSRPASSESLSVVFIVIIGTSPPPVPKTLVVLSVRPTVGPGAVMPRHKVRTAPSVKRMPSQKARGDPKVLPECHERIAPNGTSGKAETVASGRHESPFCTAIVWFHSLGIRSIRPQLGLAIPMIGHPIGGPS
jgi:hypothetical protein